MRPRRGFQAVALDGRQLERAVGQGVPHALGPLGQARARGHIGEGHRAGEGGGLLHQQARVHRPGRAAGLAQADPVPARGQGLEVLFEGRIAQAVHDDVGAVAEVLAHALGKAVVGGDDHMLATMLARKAGLVFAGHGAHHPGAQAPGPGAQQQAHATRGRMHQPAGARLHAPQVAQQVIGRHALEQQGRRHVVVHRRRQPHHVLHRHVAHAGVGAGRGGHAGHAVARHQAGHALAHVQHGAGSFHARRAGQRQQARDPAPAQVDVEVVHSHGALADAHLPRPGGGHLAVPRHQHLGATIGRDHHLPAGLRQRGGHGRAARGPQVSPLLQVPAQVLEAGLVHALGHHVAQLAFLARRRGEGGLPVPERAAPVRHGLERHGGHIALQRDAGFHDAVGGLVLHVVQRQQLLADDIAVLQTERAHAAHLAGRLPALDAALVHHGVPLVMAVEVAQHRPHALDGRVDDGGADNLLQQGSLCRISAARSGASGRRSRPGRRRRR